LKEAGEIARDRFGSIEHDAVGAERARPPTDAAKPVRLALLQGLDRAGSSDRFAPSQQHIRRDG